MDEYEQNSSPVISMQSKYYDIIKLFSKQKFIPEQSGTLIRINRQWEKYDLLLVLINSVDWINLRELYVSLCSEYDEVKLFFLHYQIWCSFDWMERKNIRF